MPEEQIKKSRKKTDLIDPIYEKYTKSIIRSLASTEFYEYFMDMIAAAENKFQFSNRKVVKSVDVRWVDAIERSLPGIQNIVESPRNVIREEELIVNVANAKKTTSDVVRHLAQHGSMVEDFDEDRGTVRPSKLMQKLRDDSKVIYENRLVFTVLEHAFHFVKIRYDAIFGAMGDEYGAKLKMETDTESATETFHMDMFVHIQKKDSILETDSKNEDVFSRISRLYRVLSIFMNSSFAQELAKANRIKGTIVKTNVLKRNPDYKMIVKLYEFLHKYDQIGYSIRVIEQSPVISETFERDIYHNIMFNYIILKGYLQDDEDREVGVPLKEKKRTIKPKFIKEIIEELTEDYNLPDVEVRKVLIEELTKAQLMQEEAEERRRLVAEQAQRKKDEAERIRKEKEAEKERIRKEKEAEKERIRQEKEAEETRLLAERMERENEDRRRAGVFRKVLEDFNENLDHRIFMREDAEKKLKESLQKAREEEEARRLREETALLKKEEAIRLREQRQAQIELEKREKQIREAQKAEEERQAAEQRRIEAEAAQHEKDLADVAVYVTVLSGFDAEISANLRKRADYENSLRESIERENEERRLRLARKLFSSKSDKRG